MKPSIPEKGTVIGLYGREADVMIEGGGHCKGCGLGKIGLCRPGGRSMRLRVSNDPGARTGDVVVVGIDRKVRLKGYLLGYIIPLAFFIAGAVFGHLAGNYLAFPSLDLPAGFLSLTLAYFFTLRRLRRLDETSSLSITRIVSGNVFDIDVKSDEQRRFEDYHDRTVTPGSLRPH